MRLYTKSQFLVPGTARFEELNDRHPLLFLMRELSRDGSSLEIPLASLSSKETARLAAQVSDKQLDADFILELYRETDGNPLFVIETVRAGLLSSLPPKVHAVLS